MTDENGSVAYTLVVAAVIERQGRLLVCQRAAHKSHGSLWEFPGGKLEPGESFLEAARRELEEELALHVTSIGDVRFCVQDPGTRFMISFVDVEAQGEPKLTEHIALGWLLPPELLDLPLAPSDRKFAEHLNSAPPIR